MVRKSIQIFTQFLDGLYQLLRQVPTEFEYSETLLLLLYRVNESGITSDFAFDNLFERQAFAKLRAEQITNDGIEEQRRRSILAIPSKSARGIDKNVTSS